MGSQLSTFNMADIWEAVSDRVGDRTAVVCGDRRLTYAELEARANRLANWFLAQGVKPGEHVALYLLSGIEYFEVMLAAYKVRAVPINVNHRYGADELVHLFEDADVVGVVFHRQFNDRMGQIIGHLPKVAFAIRVDDGTDADLIVESISSYEHALASQSSDRHFGPRSNDDPYVIYTGGTTGQPKGVLWRQEDAYFACIGGGDPMRLFGPVDEPAQIVERIIDGTFVFLPVAPLMHAAGQWTSLSWLFAGGQIVLAPGPLDGRRIWETIEAEKVNLITVVADAVVAPLVDAWDEHGPYDVSSLLSVGSGGAPLSPSLKARLMEILPNCAVVDGFGSSETGAQGSQRLEAGAKGGGAVAAFKPYGDTTTVLDETTNDLVEAGSGVIGRVARRGRIPQGYYNDPVKTAEMFVESGGHRWVLTGDMARLERDGTITLLGRGSGCINTGGEKVFPEEVETMLKSHPDVYDALVLGVADDRWGQRVAAVVQPVSPGGTKAAALIDFGRERLAGYKIPKQIVFVSEVKRTPAGKADYRWAKCVVDDAGEPGGIS